MMRAYLFEETSGLLSQTMPYIASDPSEKTSISFYLGMTLAKLFAEVRFNVPRLLHFAVYGQNYQIATGQGASRPDLIGRSTNGDWFVFEAKGRSNGFHTGALDTAKEQAEQIVSINNVAPVCRIASQSFFSVGGLRFRMVDPPPRQERQSRSLSVTPESFEQAYYAPLRAIIESRGLGMPFVIAGTRFRGSRVEELDCFIALPDLNPLSAGGSEPGSPYSQQYLGHDGVFVGLGSAWTKANMTLQPHLRSS
jgi:hypothetical protein